MITFSLPLGAKSLDELDRMLIERALEYFSGNQTKAAVVLGVTRYALRYRMKKHGLFEKFTTRAAA